MLNNCIYMENTLNLWLYLLFLLVLTWSVFQQWCRMNDLVLVLVVNSEQILHTVLVYCWCPLSITMTRHFLEEYHFLNEWNIITNNTKERICCCSCSKKTDLLVSYLLQTEAAVQRYSVRKVFLQISQNS